MNYLYFLAFWSCVYLDQFVNWLIEWAVLLLMPIIAPLALIFPSIEKKIDGSVNYAIAFCVGSLEALAVVLYIIFK
jgi:hypothetical protein